MGNYIVENYDELEARHYLRQAGGKSYWFDFAYGKMKTFQELYGEDFCLVIFSPGPEDDSFILPYSEVKNIFDPSLLQDHGRWTGAISNTHIMRVGHTPLIRTMSVAAYYNNFQALLSQVYEDIEPDLSEVFEKIQVDLGLSELKQLIQSFNERYMHVSPTKRIVISERIARPGAISDYLKQLCDYTCEMCGEVGFRQKNGRIYIETHHITQLHELMPGSYCSDNIIVVCPTCHRKLHFANVQFSKFVEGEIQVDANGTKYRFKRKIIS